MHDRPPVFIAGRVNRTRKSVHKNGVYYTLKSVTKLLEAPFTRTDFKLMSLMIKEH